MIKIMIALGVLFCILVAILIIAMCIQVKKAEAIFYEYQREYEKECLK